MGGEANRFTGFLLTTLSSDFTAIPNQYSNTPLLQHSISLLHRLLNHLPRCNMFS
jgi:hypothetical protein